MQNNYFNIQKARKIDIVEYLEKIGYQPQKINNNDYWYLSPLREEKEASFKVNRRLNIWFEHGTGRGGNFIDFVLSYHQCSFKELSEKIKDYFFFTRRLQWFNSLKQTPMANMRHLNQR